jgi:hypothetical protein
MSLPKSNETVSENPARWPANNEGFYLRDLADGAVVDIETQHRHYRLEKQDSAHVRLSGHPTFCPEPVVVKVEGSIAPQPALRPLPGFIGRGMYLVFKHPGFDRVITTSRVREIHQEGQP